MEYFTHVIVILFLVVASFITTSTFTDAQTFGLKISDTQIPLGISSGDITSNSAIIWSKTNQNATMNVMVRPFDNQFNEKYYTQKVNATTDFTGRLKAYDLNANTSYIYAVWFSGDGGDTKISAIESGRFHTAPESSKRENISFAVGGDVGGQGFCKRINVGYPIFSTIGSLDIDFFVANGDMIYADSICNSEGPTHIPGWINIPGDFRRITNENVDWNNNSELYDIYSKHWKYNKVDSNYKFLAKSIPIYSQSDDHEIADNYNGNSTFYKSSYTNRTGYSNLVTMGLKAFFNYSPIEIDSDNPNRIYREFEWGKNLQLFLLDPHQYRSQSNITDTPSNAKTLLGHEQLDWLKREIKNSNSVWKVVLSTVPLSVPHCDDADNGCDSWATDNISNKSYTIERNNLLSYLDTIDVENLIFIVTDAHYAANIKIEKDFNGDGDMLTLYEFISGPLNALTFEPEVLDPTINARYLYNETGFFNFGHYEITNLSSNSSAFKASVINSDGIPRKNSQLVLVSN